MKVNSSEDPANRNIQKTLINQMSTNVPQQNPQCVEQSPGIGAGIGALTVG